MGLGAPIAERIGASDGSAGRQATRMRAVWKGTVLAESDRLSRPVDYYEGWRTTDGVRARNEYVLILGTRRQ